MEITGWHSERNHSVPEQNEDSDLDKKGILLQNQD